MFSNDQEDYDEKDKLFCNESTIKRLEDEYFESDPSEENFLDFEIYDQNDWNIEAIQKSSTETYPKSPIKVFSLASDNGVSEGKILEKLLSHKPLPRIIYNKKKFFYIFLQFLLSTFLICLSP
jgi:hypothetical protein